MHLPRSKLNGLKGFERDGSCSEAFASLLLCFYCLSSPYLLDVFLQQLVVHFDLVLELLSFELQKFGVLPMRVHFGFFWTEHSRGVVG